MAYTLPFKTTLLGQPVIVDGDSKDEIQFNMEYGVMPCDEQHIYITEFNDNELPDEFGNKTTVLVKKTTYTEAKREAQRRYRQKYPERYCDIQNKLYHTKKQDEEWKKKFNERSKINNKKYREKKKEELKLLGIEPKKRGRPRKEPILEEKVEE